MRDRSHTHMHVSARACTHLDQVPSHSYANVHSHMRTNIQMCTQQCNFVWGWDVH